MSALSRHERAFELGFEPGFGKQYSAEDIEASLNGSFLTQLYSNGVLKMDKPYLDKLAQDLGRKSRSKKMRNKSKERFSDEMINHRIFLDYFDLFHRRVPADWRYSRQIVEDLRQSQQQAIVLPPRLAFFSLVHPHVGVRTTLLDTQPVDAEQKAILGFLGVKESHPRFGELRTLAYYTMPYIEIAFNKQIAKI